VHVPFPSARLVATATICAALCLHPAVAAAQDPPLAQPTPDVHEHVEVAGTLLTPTTDVSGTAWLPRATPMYGAHRAWRGWDLRLDGAIAVQAVSEPGERHRTGGPGTRQIDSVNWTMAMARRNVGAARVGVRTMLSAEPWTVPRCGTLTYLATGEVCDGDTIHDRQQPHDLVMELAVDVDAPLAGDWRWQAYAGLSGEPAFGPGGYPHRPSAVAKPIAHHWLDATHIAFGVVTAGVHTRRVKIEASVFNGRAPDERRSDLDLGGLDSSSARVTWLAGDRWAVQVSAARLRDARAVFERQPEPDATRTTASATYVRPMGARSFWATTAALGTSTAREVVSGIRWKTTTAAALLESSATLRDRHTILGRMEIASMPGHHLHAHEYSRVLLPIGKVQAGYVRQFAPRRGLVPGLGLTGALSLLPGRLEARYGGRTARTLSVYLLVRPARHAM
jgi:hypothetical protein